MKEQSIHNSRPLILVCALIFLSGWVEIVVQPAEAQQTVTLSGRVTDTNGQAVSGVKVDLFRVLSEFSHYRLLSTRKIKDLACQKQPLQPESRHYQRLT